MDLQKYLRDEFTGKSVVLVGNAPFRVDQSEFIDSHAIVIRFNLFFDQGYKQKLCGKKVTHWCNNLVRERQHRAERPRYWSLLKSLSPSPVVFTPSAEVKRLRTWIPLYESMGATLYYPDIDLAMPAGSTQMEPSVGFYTAMRLLKEQIPIAVIAFNGGVSDHHDGLAELHYLRVHPLVTMCADF